MSELTMEIPAIETTVVFIEKIIFLLFGQLLKNALRYKNFVPIKYSLTDMRMIRLSFTVADTPIHLHLTARFLKKHNVQLILIH